LALEASAHFLFSRSLGKKKKSKKRVSKMIMMESPKNQCRIILLPNSKRPRTALPSMEIAVFSNNYSGKTLLRRPLQQRPLKKQMKGVLPQIRKTRERKRRDRKLSSKRMNKRCFFKRESSQKMLRMTTYMRC
jgi:hypothetical protein